MHAKLMKDTNHTFDLPAVAESSAGRPQGPVGVEEATGAVGVQEGQAQWRCVIVRQAAYRALPYVGVLLIVCML
jgi:hypothetical protein